MRMERNSPYLLHRRWTPAVAPSYRQHREFRSPVALESLQSHVRSAETEAARSHQLALYNYPSFSGSFAALFAHLFHSRLRLPFLALPFSSVEPFRIEDFKSRGIATCYLLDFIGPDGFAVELARTMPRGVIRSSVVAFDHREATALRVSRFKQCPDNLELLIDTKKSSARAVHDYFFERLAKNEISLTEKNVGLLNAEQEERVQMVLNYIEDIDLRKWEFPDIRAFDIGLKEKRAMLNSATNPHVFEQLLELNSADLIAKGNSYTSSRKDAVKKLLDKAFKIRLGGGLYGECLAIRADGNSVLSHDIGVELSKRSAEVGLRPIGAVIFMQRTNLKMCLRSSNSAADTSAIAKAYGGGGNPSSSSFIIRMDEYNQWRSAYSSLIKQ